MRRIDLLIRPSRGISRERSDCDYAPGNRTALLNIILVTLWLFFFVRPTLSGCVVAENTHKHSLLRRRLSLATLCTSRFSRVVLLLSGHLSG